MALRSTGGLPTSITRAWTGGYYFPEDEPFWIDPWQWIDFILPDPPIFDTGIPSGPSVPDVIEEVPRGWETVIIGGVERVRVPDVYQGPEPVLEPFDPDVVIGEVQGADTSEQEDELVAHDWGHLIRQGIGELTGIGQPGPAQLPAAFAPGADFVSNVALGGGGAVPVAGGADCDGMAWSGGTPPKGYKVVNYCGRGVLRKVRRRRRRRLLTRGDSQDIATIVGLVGKGQMASALINRRS